MKDPTSPERPPVLPSRADRILDAQRQAEADFQEVTRAMVLYGAMLLPVLVATAWGFHDPESGNEPEVIASVALYLVILGFGWAWRVEWIELLRPPSNISFRLKLLIVFTPCVTVGSVVIMSLLANFAGIPVINMTSPLLSANWPIWLCFVWIAVLPSIFEEIAFRGLMFSKLLRATTPRNAVWITSILFGVMHFNVLGMAFFLIPLALVAAYLTRRTRSLYPAIFIHAAHNAAIVGLELWV